MNVSDTNYCIWVYEEAPYTEDHFYLENCAPREQKFDFGSMKYFVCLKGKQFFITSISKASAQFVNHWGVSKQPRVLF